MTLTVHSGQSTDKRTGKRIGVFGGAFDPPHAAHLALARLAVAQLQLDALKIFPTGHAWHKSRTLTAPEHRLAMAQLAFADLAQAQVDASELLRAGPTYTIDTLTQLQAENPGCQLFLIIGADQAMALSNWHRFEDILRIAIICVAGRATTARTAGSIDADSQVPPGLARSRFESLHLPPMAVSATDIRHRVATDQDIHGLVSEPIARYIAHHHLYHST